MQDGGQTQRSRSEVLKARLDSGLRRPGAALVRQVTVRLDRMVDTLAETVEGPPPVRGAAQADVGRGRQTEKRAPRAGADGAPAL